MTNTLSTHVLDAALGLPARGLAATLTGSSGLVATTVTDDDGRIRWDAALEAGGYAIALATGEWFAAQGRDTWFQSVRLEFVLGEGHTHVATLLSPYAYTAYRGS